MTCDPKIAVGLLAFGAMVKRALHLAETTLRLTPGRPSQPPPQSKLRRRHHRAPLCRRLHQDLRPQERAHQVCLAAALTRMCSKGESFFDGCHRPQDRTYLRFVLRHPRGRRPCVHRRLAQLHVLWPSACCSGMLGYQMLDQASGWDLGRPAVRSTMQRKNGK